MFGLTCFCDLVSQWFAFVTFPCITNSLAVEGSAEPELAPIRATICFLTETALLYLKGSAFITTPVLMTDDFNKDTSELVPLSVHPVWHQWTPYCIIFLVRKMQALCFNLCTDYRQCSHNFTAGNCCKLRILTTSKQNWHCNFCK